MRIRILVLILAVSLVCPSFTHASGFMRWFFDGISNQLGLDRGAIPKTPPKPAPPVYKPGEQPMGKHAEINRIYIQAEGF